MQKKIYSLLSVLVTFSFINFSYGQCSSNECTNKLNNGYLFIKSYSMEQSESEMEFSYAFSKDNNYMLVTCLNGGSENYKLTLLDANKNIVATNFDESTQKYYSQISFNCKTTGIYYLKYSFEENPSCGICIVGFKNL